MKDQFVHYKKRIFMGLFMLPISLMVLLAGMMLPEDGHPIAGVFTLLCGILCLISLVFLIRRLFLPYAIRYNDRKMEFVTVDFKGKKTIKIENELVKDEYHDTTISKGNEMNNFNFFMTHADKEKLGFKLTKKEKREQADGVAYTYVAIDVPDLKREEKKAFLAFLDKKFSSQQVEEEPIWTSGIE